jgi:hypothetical protein
MENCFQKCGFSLNQTRDGEDATELSVVEDDWGQLKAGGSIQEYVSCDNDIVMFEVQTLKQIMDENLHLMCLRRWRGKMMRGKVNLQQHFCHY